jgi:hypothetical protein
MSEPGVRALRELITASWLSQAIYVAARLGIADLVVDGPRSVDELAAATDVNSDALYRVLRAVASAGLLAESGPRRFSLAPLGHYLRTGYPDSVRHLAIWYGEEVFRSYADILQSVKDGRPVFERIHGKDMWAYLASHPSANETFNLAMGTSRWQDQRPIIEAYDFRGIKCLVDVGGGEGSMLAAVLHAHPEMTGVLVDLPNVVRGAQRHLESAGVADRCRVVAGSVYDALPGGGDAYVLSSVLHFMDDQQVLVALGRVREAIAARGRVLVIERVLPPDDSPHFGKLLDLTMLVLLGGRERTEAEFRALYERSGFRLSRVVWLPFFVAGIGLGVVEGEPV